MDRFVRCPHCNVLTHVAHGTCDKCAQQLYEFEGDDDEHNSPS